MLSKWCRTGGKTAIAPYSIVALCAVILALASCSNSQQKVDRIQQSLDSWNRSLDYAHEQWQQHNVPDTYVGQVLKVANENLQAVQKQIQQISKIDPEKKGSLSAAAAMLETKIRDQNRLLLKTRTVSQ